MEKLLRENHLIWSITAFMFMFAAFLYLKPSIAFGPRGSLCGCFSNWSIIFCKLCSIGVEERIWIKDGMTIHKFDHIILII